jgi:hypothetical protein
MSDSAGNSLTESHANGLDNQGCGGTPPHHLISWEQGRIFHLSINLADEIHAAGPRPEDFFATVCSTSSKTLMSSVGEEVAMQHHILCLSVVE